MDKYAVIGNPISHSLSPEIHMAFARQTSQPIEYTRLLAPVDGFTRALDEFVAGQGKGLSVTMPFKLPAFERVEFKSERAILAGAVNTIRIEPDGQLFGENTDGVGFIADVTRNLRWSIKDQRVLILGAGGAARGILHLLLKESPAELIIANRTIERAVKLADENSAMGNVAASGLNKIRGEFDLIINATGASLQGKVPEVPNETITAHTNCYDMAYATSKTPFIRWALEKGAAKTSDGLGMLVEQAAAAFQIWRDVMPATIPVINSIRSAIKDSD